MQHRTSQQVRRGARSPFGALGAGALALATLSGFVLPAVPAGAASTVVVATAKSPKGTVLESGGATLYILKGNKPCTGQCLKFWPALVLAKGQGKAKAGTGVKHRKLSSVKRNGVRQVTYGGKPLYKFIGDHGTGQVNGNITDTWGTWAAVVVAKPKTASHTGTTSSGTTSTTGSGGTAF